MDRFHDESKRYVAVRSPSEPTSSAASLTAPLSKPCTLNLAFVGPAQELLSVAGTRSAVTKAHSNENKLLSPKEPGHANKT